MPTDYSKLKTNQIFAICDRIHNDAWNDEINDFDPNKVDEYLIEMDKINEELERRLGY